MTHSRLRPSFTLTDDKLAQLHEIVPEAFADGRINWGALREALGNHFGSEEGEAEHFGLFWPGKRDARRMAALPPQGTLVPAPGEGVDEATTHNLFIEGENLEVLKLLQKSYAGRVKMIYIDPPYNTGNDFIYEDDFKEPIETYLKRTGQIRDSGEVITTNTRADGRFHSKWLTMMYPRLRLARSLLKDDGLLFVSADDNEASHLRLLLDELFGPENFVAAIAWEKRFTRSNNAKLFYSLKDTILLYRRTNLVAALREPRTEKSDGIYSNPDKDPRGPWTSSSYVNPATKEDRPNLVYALKAPDGRTITHPTHAWKYERSEYERHTREKRLWWGRDKSAKYPRLKVFLSEAEGGLVPIDLWDYRSSGTTDEGGSELKELFGEAVFDNPKPTKLVRRMLDLASVHDEEDIVMDFFAGSGTTPAAVLQANHHGQRSAKYIAVQLQEPTGRDDYRTIADITKERIRRVGRQLKMAEGGRAQDLGFKVFRLARSQYRNWEAYDGASLTHLQLRFDETEQPLIDDWNPEALLCEIMLLEGFPLDSLLSRIDSLKTNIVTRIVSANVSHCLLACFDKKLHSETLKNIEPTRQDIFVCLDSALTDDAKVRLADRCQLKTI